jgi:hypothetical protein
MKKTVLSLLILITGLLLFGCTSQSSIGIKDCGEGNINANTDCFDSAYKNCEPAKYTQIQDNGKTTFEIIGFENENCAFNSEIYINNKLTTKVTCSIPKELLSEGIRTNKINDYCEMIQ